MPARRDGARASSELSSARASSCYEIRPGDTAARLAQRFTGNEFNRYRIGFQIVDPTTGAFIAKSRYNVIQSGWHVCVATAMLRLRSLPAGYVVSPTIPVLPQISATQQAAVIDFRMWSWATPLFVVISVVVLAWSWKYGDERRARLDMMRVFGNRFIAEFERPLLPNALGDPLRARIKFAPRRRKLEILLAPGHGRTYPNLVDHKRNVEYDVARVLRILRHEPFVSGRPYAKGRWVVIPCRFEAGRQQEGVL
jgi:hypothetical protein